MTGEGATAADARVRLAALGAPLRHGARVATAALRRRRAGRFALGGREYRYFAHPYNTTWRNERAVEVPIALRLLDDAGPGRVLEVGNVLAHYGRRGHDVVDKYEPAAVIRTDILDFRPDLRYDAIVAISTLEHVGFDEDVRDDAKPRAALEHMASLLAPGGSLLVTVPLGYNPALDRDLLTGALGFDELGFLARVSRGGRWEERAADAVAGTRYGHPYRWANAVAVGQRHAAGP